MRGWESAKLQVSKKSARLLWEEVRTQDGREGHHFQRSRNGAALPSFIQAAQALAWLPISFSNHTLLQGTGNQGGTSSPKPPYICTLHLISLPFPLGRDPPHPPFHTQLHSSNPLHGKSLSTPISVSSAPQGQVPSALQIPEDSAGFLLPSSPRALGSTYFLLAESVWLPLQEQSHSLCSP